MMRSSGLNGASSSSPSDFTAIFINSFSGIPVERSCFSKKYFPASIKHFKGIMPTSSEPVTRIPFSLALFDTSSNAL